MPFKKCRERPTYRACEPSDQCDARNRAASSTAIQAGEGGESRVVKTHCHADTQESPRDRQRPRASCRPEQSHPRRENEVRERKHASTAMLIDDATDRRAEKRRN